MFSIASLTLVVGGVFSSWAITDNAADVRIKVNIAEAVRTVTFYTSFDGSSWGDEVEKMVFDGGSVDSIPTVSLSGYTFKGWKKAAPTYSSYAADYSNNQVLAMTFNDDEEFYPVLESNSDYAYTNSTYYQAGVDVTIPTNTIGATRLGKRYCGVDSIPNAVATWDDTRDVYAASGIYKFENVSGGAMLYRKIGFKPNSNWSQNFGSGTPAFFMHLWDGAEADVKIGNSLTNGVMYNYIPANAKQFLIRRNDHNQATIDWDHGNKSADLSFDSSWWWNSSSTNKYSSSTIVLSMNSDASWDNWGSNAATWIDS